MEELEFEEMRTISDVYIAKQNLNPSTHLNKTCNYLNMKLDNSLMRSLERQDLTFKNRLESMIMHIECGKKLHLDPTIVQKPLLKLPHKRFDLREWLKLFCTKYGYDLTVSTDFLAFEQHIRQNKQIFNYLSNNKVPIGRERFYIIIYNLVCNDT
tara:strand:+ start:193 stop:657 length:465 start_codon:yes stop_codon:yes gene_type:complete